MFDVDSRKTNTKLVIKFTKDNLFKLNENHVMNGFYVLLVHWICCAIPSFVIFLGSVNIYFYLSCLAWLIIICAHIYFKGCIFTRIERELWQDKTWCGPWVFPFKLLNLSGVEVTPNLSNNIFTCWGIFLCIFVFLKILWKA